VSAETDEENGEKLSQPVFMEDICNKSLLAVGILED